MQDPLQRLVGKQVVMDTATSIVYLGTLTEVTEAAFVLTDADVHDCRDGHATKEVYTAVACAEGVPVNRRTVYVARSFIMSVSALEDVVMGGENVRLLDEPRG